LAAFGGAPVGAGTRTGYGVRALGVGVVVAGSVPAGDPLDDDADGVGATLPRGVVGLGRPQPAKAATSVVAASAAASTRLTGKVQPS